MQNPTELGYDPDTMALDGIDNDDRAPIAAALAACAILGAIMGGLIVAAVLTWSEASRSAICGKDQSRVTIVEKNA